MSDKLMEIFNDRGTIEDALKRFLHIHMHKNLRDDVIAHYVEDLKKSDSVFKYLDDLIINHKIRSAEIIEKLKQDKQEKIKATIAEGIVSIPNRYFLIAEKDGQQVIVGSANNRKELMAKAEQLAGKKPLNCLVSGAMNDITKSHLKFRWVDKKTFNNGTN